MPIDSLALLAILLLLAAGAGWLAARFKSGQKRATSRSPLSAEYFQGLTFLLNQQPDKAIEVFLRMVEVDKDTIETHFALASLFRQRGEVDRAIRIHQNLIARPNLERSQRDRALFELGEDYLRAGLYDRSERLFSELAGTGSHRVAALENLVRIFELQQDWQQAIAARRRLEALTTPAQSGIIAHYYCELAEQARTGKDRGAARTLLKKAQSSDRRNVRGALLRADIAAEAGDHKLALRLYRRVLEEDHALAGEVLPRLRGVCAALGKADGLERLLRELCEREPALRVQLAHAAIASGDLDDAVSAECVQELLHGSDALRELLDVCGLRESIASDRASLEALCGALRRMAESSPRYSCRVCGYASDGLYWQCPGCRMWDTTRPVTTLPLRV